MANRKQRRQIKRLFKRVTNILLRKKDPQNKNLWDLFNTFHNLFIAPEDFQSPLSWGPEQKVKYFDSILMNRIEGTIVVVNVPKALAALKRYGNKNAGCSSISKAVKLFERAIADGKKWIVIDANNRLDFICNLLADNYAIPEGEYEYIPDADDNYSGSFVVDKTNNRFSLLPDLVQEAIKSRVTVISEYVQTDWQGMSIAFINTNNMVAPNEQEIRNAFYSEWPEFIRNLRKHNIDLLSLIFTKDPVKRYCGDEFLLNCIALDKSCIVDTETLNEFSAKVNEGKEDEEEALKINVACKALTQKVKDDIYISEFDEDETAYYERVFMHLYDNIRKMQKNKVPFTATQSLIQNLFWLMCNGIDTYQEFQLAVKYHQDAYSDANITYSDDAATFKNACSGSTKKNIEFRYIILSRIVERVKLETLVTPMNETMNIEV